MRYLARIWAVFDSKEGFERTGPQVALFAVVRPDWMSTSRSTEFTDMVRIPGLKRGVSSNL